MDIFEVAMAVVAAAVVICSPVLLVRAYDRYTRPVSPRPARDRREIANDLVRLRTLLSDELITVGDRRRTAAAYDRVLAEACDLHDIKHVLRTRFMGDLDRELERFRAEAALQATGWSVRTNQDA